MKTNIVKKMNDKLHKMKLYEIQQICKKLKITYKRKNKSTLINILLNPLKYSYKMNVMKMTNGYQSQFPEYLTNNIASKLFLTYLYPTLKQIYKK